MASSWSGSYDLGSQSDDGFQLERSHIEPIYDSFVCPLTKLVMRDPVTLENGHTFEREAIEKWFRECRESGRRPVCPLTLKELRSTELSPSLALRNTIEEWTSRNEAVQLDIASRSLSISSSEDEILQALKYIQHICKKSRSNKHAIRNNGLIPMVVNMLKSSSRRVRVRALETLRIVAEDDAENKVVLFFSLRRLEPNYHFCIINTQNHLYFSVLIVLCALQEVMGNPTTIRTIVKFLSNELSQEREEAVALLYELSKCESLCEKIGEVNGAILILVGMASSSSENVLTVERADKTLENLEKCEKNVFQMAENGRLQPLLTLLLEGIPFTSISPSNCEFSTVYNLELCHGYLIILWL